MTAELAKRAGFTIGALLLYRLGCVIPLPGLDIGLVERIFRDHASANLESLRLPSGGMHHISILALGIAPYIAAAVVLQLAGMVCRPLRSLQSRGDHGRQLLRRLTLGLTAILAAFQAWAIAVGVEGIRGAVDSPGPAFLASTIVTLTGGVIFLAWLSDQITMFGIGNGIALILLAGMTPSVRDSIVGLLEDVRRGLVPDNAVQGLVLATILITVIVVQFERARLRFPIVYAKNPIGIRDLNMPASILAVKVNPAGIIPVVVASWLLTLITVAAGLITKSNPHASLLVAMELIRGRPVDLALRGILIFVCTLFYAAYLFDPAELAERLRWHGGSIGSIAPGSATIAYLDRALSRSILIGTIYLTAVCLIPDLLASYAKAPFYFGGLSLLILVCTILDLETEIRGRLGRSP